MFKLFAEICLFGASIASLLVGAAIILRDIKARSNLYFAGICFSLSGWAFGIGMFEVVTDEKALIFWIKFYYLVALLIGIFYLLFSFSYPSNKKLKKYAWAILLSSFVFAIILIFGKSFITRSVAVEENGVKNVVLNKPAYAIYSIFFLSSFYAALTRMYLMRKKAHGSLKKHLGSIITGTLLASVFGVTFNLILPWFNNYQLVWVGPLFGLVFVAIIANAIIKHKLFDIRAAIARFMAYSVSISLISLIFSVLILASTKLLSLGHGLTIAEQSVFIISAVVISLVFPTIKNFFDKVSNRFFFQDAYEPQFFIDELNKVLVSNIDLEALLINSSRVIQNNLKSSFCVFYLYSTSYSEGRIIGTRNDLLDDAEVNKVRELSKSTKGNVVVLDRLQEQENKDLIDVLREAGVSSILKLAASTEDNSSGFGYLMIGAKKSGNALNSTDNKMLDILANELVIAIQNALRFEEIEKFNLTLQQKVDDATKELKKTNEKLLALDEAKDEFISMASHQLRTPLTSVKGYVSMVLEGDAGKVLPMQRQLLEQAFTSSQRMVYLIADLLNVSRLKTGKFIIENKPTNLAEVVQGEVDQLLETARLRSLKLIYKMPKDFPVVNLDETKVRQVAMNFIDNAIYYTPVGGTVKVELKATDKSIEYRVIDNGIGVPKSQRHHLFTKFYRAENAQKVRPDGTGLGLYMAKKVIVAQGGSIIFDTEEGKGSTFGFSFPRN